jgi:hypothetical protein
MYIRKAKAEKDCKNMTRKLKEQKAIKTKEKAAVVDRMLQVFEQNTAVAVSGATLELAGELKQSKRAGEGLKHKLGKSQVYSLLLAGSAKPSPISMCCMLCLIFVIFFCLL